MAVKVTKRGGGKTEVYTRRKLAEKEGLCGAQRRDGYPCSRTAGWGTGHLGEGRCRDHEGKAGVLSTVKKLAESLSQPIPVTPAQAIAGVLHLSAGQLEFITRKVGELEEDDLMDEHGNLNPWLVFQRDVMNRTANYAVNATAMGLDEKLAKLAETQTRMVTALIDKVMDEVDLTPAQRKRVGPAVRKNLTMLEGKATEVKD